LNNTLTAVPGIRVGHATDLEAATGCTVVICPPNTTGGVDQRGGAPGTRETDLLRPLHLVEHVHAVVLSGGSAYGLAAADGVMRFLEAQGTGFLIRPEVVVPIVPAAILFDLDIGSAEIRPDAAAGYAAARSASSEVVAQGNVGAGTGCRVGTLRGNAWATKGGLGCASIDLGGGLIVAALAAVNALGDVVDEDGSIIAGLRGDASEPRFAGTLEMLRAAAPQPRSGSHTVIGVLATNAALTKDGANLVAQMAHDGLARAVRPAHTLYDGDTIFALATGTISADTTRIGAFAAEVMAGAIRSGVRAARTLHGVRAWHE
jgi:L-aminopeptidase/D-esterase-like protein